MGLVLDEPTENDEVFKQGDLDIIIDESILRQLGGVRIHSRDNRYIGREFVVTRRNPAAIGGCSCS